jgi:two-component system, cell cycle sensor histidine kinase and response regulator CckA
LPITSIGLLREMTACSTNLRRLLILDDDPEFLEVYRALFEVHGYTVTTFTKGADAVRHVMTAEIDAIICDLLMPTMPGDMFYLAVERVKPALCGRFIFVTGYENHPKFAEFMAKIKPVVLYKPVTIGKLLGTLTCLNERLSKKAPSRIPGVQPAR